MPGKAGAGTPLGLIRALPTSGKAARRQTDFQSRDGRKARLAFPSATPATRFSNFPSILREIADSSFALVFPTACSICSREHVRAGWAGLCADCWSQIHSWGGAVCEQCGLPFATQVESQGASWLCGNCRTGNYDFDFARTFGVYTEPLRSAILLLKFQRRERLGLELGELLAAVWFEHSEFAGAERPILVPVPLHRSRQRERGFNQAEVVARGLARRLRKESHRTRQRIETRCLLRIRPTVPQTGLTFKQRLENVRGVFQVNSPDAVKGRVIVLLDDVMTTGATLSSCAGALKKAGAARVLGITLARATPQFPDSVSPVTDEAVDEFN